jgi:flagellar hook-associated protein 1
MSIFSAIQKGANALQVAELGLHVVGNNLANAGTPGYIRQELIQTSGPAVRIGGSIIGSGVKAHGVRQKIDEFLVERIREVRGELEASDRQGAMYNRLESILGEMNDNDLSSKMNEFSTSIQDLLNQPGNEALRRLVIERGKTLAGQIRSIGQQLKGFNTELNGETTQTVGEINRLTSSLAALNVRIVELEGGRDSKTSDAVGLRDERLQVLNELSSYVGIRAVEQDSGSVSVFVGGEYLVADGIQRELKISMQTDASGLSFPEVRLADTDYPLEVVSGRLSGIYASREQAVNGIGGQLDNFARTVIEQFNLIHTQGQGSAGFSEVTSSNATDDHLGPLDLAGFWGKIKNGDFQIQVNDLESGSVKTHTIRVSLTGATNDSSLENIRQQLNDISGISATITNDGRMKISADSHKLQFTFQKDSSNFLSAVGINTFFVGDSATTIDVNSVLTSNPSMLAASLTGIGNGTQNAVRLAQAFEDPLESLEGRSLKESYEDMVVRVTQDVSIQAGKSEGLRNFYQTLESQHLGTSGVNMDEEAVKMIFYQRVFQANSKLIQTSNELLETLVNL